MKKTLVWLFAMIVSGASLMAQEQLDFNLSSIPEVKTMQKREGVVANHSLSATIVGLEYTYEARLGKAWSLASRFGVSTCLSWIEGYIDENTMHVESHFYPLLALTLEPRYYFTLEKRVLAGKKTVNNSASFFSLQTKVYDNHWDTPLNIHLSVIPTFGIRRGGEHWFREYTFGLAFHSMLYGLVPLPVLPHLNFRLGSAF